jgi:Methyltransferase small domain
MRTLAARLAPDWLKAHHQRWRERRRVDALGPLTRAYRERHGGTVRGGPFAGLRYPDELVQVPKAVGTYELELHPAIEALVAAAPRQVVNVGAGEGYYAIGLARRLPHARVLAFDIDEDAQRDCRRLAELNRVADRVEVASECSLEVLRALPDSGVAVVMDCEGCELSLLRPDVVPAMRGWRLLVELHDFVVPGLSEQLLARFRHTHAVEPIDQRPRDDLEPAELSFLSARERAVALDEFRPALMRWAHLRPR